MTRAAVFGAEILGDAGLVLKAFETLVTLAAGVSDVAGLAGAKTRAEDAIVTDAIWAAIRARCAVDSESTLGAGATSVCAAPAVFHRAKRRASVALGDVAVVAGLGAQNKSIAAFGVALAVGASTEGRERQ
jgi:hypothetical protein